MLLIAGSGVGHAQHVEPVSVTGSCSRAATWELTAQRDGGSLAATFRVDSRAPGERWRFSVARTGSTFATGSRRTRGSGGVFRVARDSGPVGTAPEVITARAHNLRTGEVCLGTLQA